MSPTSSSAPATNANMSSIPGQVESKSHKDYVSSFTEDEFRQCEERIKVCVQSRQHSFSNGETEPQPLTEDNIKRAQELTQDSVQGRDCSPTVTEPARVLHVGPNTKTDGWHTEDSKESTLNAGSSVARLSGYSDYSIDLEKLEIPGKRQPRPIRLLRHTLWNVYRRLFSFVFAVNAVALIVFLCKADSILHINIWNLATAASANIFVATAIRQDYIQGILYHSAWLVPQSAPLRVRRIIAKIYENGGVHSGCGVAGTIWFLALTIILSVQYGRGLFDSRAVLSLTYVLQVLLLLIVALAYPALRSKYHNHFEVTHRFAGWTVIILFWVELGLLANAMAQKEHTTVGLVLVKQTSFWLIILITIHAILPWLNLRRWEFRAENLSNHAVRLHFRHNVGPYTGIAISKSPLLEWHPFATMPSLKGESTGGSLIVSSAGDWTEETVKNPRPYYWVKGIPKPGVLGLSIIFRRVVIVTTGSGIGPCLSIIASPFTQMSCRILWTGPKPEQVFGPEVVNSVRQADPNAIIIDSRASGRPNMVALTYRLYLDSGAEAVFVISNPALTRKIVYSMESRGIPAFGPIWDS